MMLQCWWYLCEHELEADAAAHMAHSCCSGSHMLSLMFPSRRKQGKDDLRQDAVMQQVFSMCSMLLQRNTDTRKRKLNIRRYKVLPFVLH